MAAFPRPAAFAVSFLLLLGGCDEMGAPEVPSASVTSAETSPSATPVEAVATTPGAPSYDVSLRGSVDGVRWRGTEEVTFTNRRDAPLRRVWFRLWGNGIQRCDPVAIQVSAVVGGEPGTLRLGCTALAVTLPTALAPGGRATIGFDLAIDVPRRNDRFGYHEGMALLGNALPILAVRDDQGWHLDPYVDIGESFFSVVGRYRVTLDVPAALRTPATGTLVNESPSGDRVARTYVARDVRDFAWAAADLDRVGGDAGGVTVTLWYRPSFMTASAARLALRDAIRAMTTYADAFGDLPYARVDVVAAAFTTFGGMEYPRLVFSNPERRTLAHELAHQWWYAVVGNDQFAEPWLDESFATWASLLPWTPWQRCPSYRWPSANARLTNDMAYWGAHPREYQTIYEGGGCMLADLADRFGLRRFTDLLAATAAAHWLGVNTTPDVQHRIERAAERHLEGFDATAYWETWRVG